MLVDLFSLFNSVFNDLPNCEWFIYIMASATLFGIGCLIKNLIVKED